MTQKSMYLTPEGLASLEAELEYLKKVRRQEVAQRLQSAKELGGTQNNAEYDDAKKEQAFAEGRLLTLENILKHAMLISSEEAARTDWVKVGSRVTLLGAKGDREQYHIVGSAEADPSQRKISYESPVGKALLGRRVGDTVDVKVPAGLLKFVIVEIG